MMNSAVRALPLPAQRAQDSHRLAWQLAELAASAASVAQYREAALATLARTLGFERAFTLGSGADERIDRLGGDVAGVVARRAPPWLGEGQCAVARAPASPAGFVLVRGRAFTRDELSLLACALPVHALSERMLARQAADPFQTWADACGLTQREREVCALVVRGLTNAEVAHVLRCSVLTVRNHLVRVFHKGGISNRAELIFHALTTQTAPLGYARAGKHET